MSEKREFYKHQLNRQLARIALAERLARGEIGPKPTCDFAEDGRYIYPKLLCLIIFALNGTIENEADIAKFSRD